MENIEENTVEETQEEDNNAIKQMRERIKELEGVEKEYKSVQMDTAIKDAGFDPSSGQGKALKDLYKGDLEVDAIKAFAAEQYGWGEEAPAVQEQEAQKAKSEAEQELASLQGSWAGLRSSLEAEVSLTSSYPLVNAIRALTRPALTLLLWVITALVFFNVETDMKARIVETSVFAATAATLWWFGDRTGPAHRPRPA